MSVPWKHLSFGERFDIGIKFFYLDILYTFLAMLLFVMTGLISKLPPIIESELSAFGVFLVVILAPIGEEFVFRFLPLRIVLHFSGNRLNGWVWIVTIVSSIIFGYLHGSVYNIFVQGAGGFILSLAFLRGGYIASATSHIAFNTTFTVLSFL